MPLLFNHFGSDKTRAHNYHRIYCPILAPRRNSTRSIVELGAYRGAGLAAYATFFPNAQVYGIDDARLSGLGQTKNAEGSLVPSHRGIPLNLGPRESAVHIFVAQLNSLVREPMFDGLRELGRGGAVGLPREDIDVVIDDADHFLGTQLNNFRVWFPRVRDGGLYIIEDIFVTPTPWPGWDTEANRVPNNNTDCGSSCYFPQRPADHPLLAAQPQEMASELRDRDWFFSITGLHMGGGLDMTMVIVK